MMKYINVSAAYPEENAEEIFDALSLGLGYKEEDGDKQKFIESKFNEHFDSMLRGTYHAGKRIKMNIPQVNFQTNPRGLGDSVANTIGFFTKFFLRFAKWISMNCGCDQRREWLNKKFPYKQK
jgi:hypothetical protein